ncbi:MAG: CoA-binding protein [Schleiferiaceae bacterium]|nr:CoA-binding protein [Schleiferiaceae bacterium]
MENSPITLVLGASPNPARYSNMAIQRLVANNIPVVAVGLRTGVVAGVPILNEIPTDSDIDTVTLYVGPDNLQPWIPQIIALQPRRVIFNPGTENNVALQQFTESGIRCETACTLVMLGVGTY